MKVQSTSNELPTREHIQDQLYFFADVAPIRVDVNIRANGRFVRCGETGQSINFAAKSFGINAFGVATNSFAQIAFEEDFNERRRMRRSYCFPHYTVWCDSSDDYRDALLSKQTGDIAHAPYVHATIFTREAEFGSYVFPEVVAVDELSRGTTKGLCQRSAER